MVKGTAQRDPEDVREFLIEAGAFLDDLEPTLARIRSGGEAGPESIAAMFRAFHSIKGVSGFLSFLEVQESTHKAEEVLDKVRAGKLPLDSALADALLEACDVLRKLFAAIEATGEDKGLSVRKDALIERLREYSGRNKAEGKTAPAAGSAGGDWSKRGGFIFDFLKAGDVPERVGAEAIACVEAMELCLFELLDSPAKISVLKDAADLCSRLRLNAEAFGYAEAAGLAGTLDHSLRRPRPDAAAVDTEENTLNFKVLGLLKSLLKAPQPAAADIAAAAHLAEDLAALQRVPAAEKPAPAAASKNGESFAAPAAGKKGDIRVSLDKLDKMVDLIEELGVAASSLSYQAENLEATGEGEVRAAAGKLRQVTEELQEVAMSVRMVPLSTLFRKMVRLVGDVSSKLGKKASLEITGEETEVDKDVAEALQDPLVHILRNCLDHGLETPEQRSASGKAETGVVQLQAWYSGGEACISISDDGRGIDCGKVLAKAVSQGLAKAGDSFSDAEALAFLFHPGFSLAKEVTEFSGRGVGMDVVKKNIEKLKGKVEIETRPGKGSTFLVHIPMSNALTESMLVRVGESRYVIRVSSIRETFRPEPGALTRLPDGSELVRVRGETFSVVRLPAPRSGEAKAPDGSGRGLLVLVENHGRHLALFVDEVLGKIQSVIKSPPDLLKSSRTLAGYSIIGTGTDDVAWALDIDAVAAKAGVGT